MKKNLKWVKLLALLIKEATLHLSGWEIILLTLHQVSKLSMSFCKILQSDSLCMARQILVSSAKRQIFVPRDITELMSFMKRTNNRGPKIDPCGTPDLTDL